MMDTDLPDETTSLMVDTQHQISRRGKQGFHKGKALAAGALLFFAVVCTSGSIYSSLDDETDEIERGFPLFGNHHKKHHHHSKTNDKNVSSTVSYNSIGAVEDILTLVKKLTNHHDDKDHKKEKKHKHDKKKHKPHEGDGKDISAVVDSSNVTVSDGIVPAANSTDPEEDGTVIDGRGSIDFKGDTVNADSNNSSSSNGAGVVTDSVSSVSEGGTESKTPTNGTLPTEESGSIDKPVVEDQNADSDASARSNGPGSRDDGKSSSDNKSTEGRASAIDSESSSSSSSPSQSKSVSDDTDSPDSHDETDNSNYDKSDTPGANKESDSSIDNPGSSDTSTMPSESLNNDVDDGAVSTSASGAAGDEGNGVTGNLTAVPVAVNDNAGNISDFVF